MKMIRISHVKIGIATSVLAILLAGGGSASAQGGDHPKSWTERIEPFRIADQVYYVGSRDLASILIDSGKGLILIDAGMPEFAPQVLANIRALGFDPRQVKILLGSQAHFDHAGGLAAIKAATGARMLASAADGRLLERGGKGDFAWGDELAYPALKVDGTLRDGQRVRLGGVTLTAHITPGHTKGCTTWTFPVTDRGRTHIAQFNCSASIPGYKLLRTPLYPNMASDYARTFAKMRRLPCDIFLGAHGSFFDLDAKRAKIGTSAANPFVDPQGCKNYIARAEASYREQLAREQKDLATRARK
jgi:metallo-beta-lactamase class B